MLGFGWKRLRGRVVPHNAIIDRVVRSVTLGDLRGLHDVDVVERNLTRHEHEQWLTRYVPEWRNRFGDSRHKKLLEFFISFTLLGPEPHHGFMDAGGAMFTYLHRLPCARLWLHDVQIPPTMKAQLGPSVTYVESDAARIPLPDGAVDRIACHHSFEHFQRASDTDFVREVQRLLAPAGRCCIVPIFIGDRYVEVTDALTLSRKFDRRSTRVIDPTASIPGGKWCGNYARIYDLAAFRDRVLDSIDRDRFDVALVAIRLDGEPVPDLTLPFHRHVTAINRPYVAMVITRTR